jgi:hypothetical protein
MVRFFDIAVPERGVAAFGKYGRTGMDEARSALMDQVEQSLAKNHGVLMDAWIELLLKRDKSSEIRERVEWFVKTYADPSSPVTMRIGRKIGLLYAAGWIAQRAGLLPWPDKRPKQVAKYIYNNIVRGLPAHDGPIRDLIGKLRAAIENRHLFLSRTCKGEYIVFPPNAIGLHNKIGEGERCLLHPDGLRNLGVPADACVSVCDQLLERGIITRSRNASGTVQERVLGGDGRIRKIRFWVLNLDRLRAPG